MGNEGNSPVTGFEANGSARLERHARIVIEICSDLSGGEGGILTQPLLPSYHLFSNMHEKRMNTGDFYDFYNFNSTKIFSCLVLIFALNRHQRHQGSDRASRTLIRTL